MESWIGQFEDMPKFLSISDPSLIHKKQNSAQVQSLNLLFFWTKDLGGRSSPWSSDNKPPTWMSQEVSKRLGSVGYNLKEYPVYK